MSSLTQITNPRALVCIGLRYALPEEHRADFLSSKLILTGTPSLASVREMCLDNINGWTFLQLSVETKYFVFCLSLSING